MSFGSESTTDEVLEGVDLSGLWVLITGASAGLGQETARAVAAHGGNVVLGVRDVAKGERATEPVRAAAASSGATVELCNVDLASLASIRAFTDGVMDAHDRLDVLIANAGVMATPEGRTTDGFELQLGTNHLGHFVLVNRLRPLIGSPGRIVNLSSAGHRFSDVVLDDINFERTPYDPWQAYGRSKTANILFAVELDRRGREAGQRACAVHPGTIITEEVDPRGRGDERVGRLRRGCRGRRWSLLPGLCGGAGDRRAREPRGCVRMRHRSRTGEGPVGPFRGAGRRVVPRMTG